MSGGSYFFARTFAREMGHAMDARKRRRAYLRANEPGLAWSLKRVGKLLLVLIVSVIVLANLPEAKHGNHTGPGWAQSKK